MRAEILSIGTELLLGQIVDTNAQFLAQELAPLGIDLYWVSQVGDNLGRLEEVIRRAWARSDVVICTGGLGPTEDDVTREGIAAALEEPLDVDPGLAEDVRALFRRRGWPMPDRNLKQANLIPSARPLPNPNGTAPGWWVERNGKLLVAMPGVPREMMPMWQEQVLPRLLPRCGGTILSRTLKTLGLGESAVEERLGALTRSPNPTVATYAKPDGVHVRISAKAPTEAEASILIAQMEERLRPLLDEYTYGRDDDTIEQVIGDLLRSRQMSLACLESCTGGLVASAITDAPGSSVYFRGGLVAYSRAAKVQAGVDPTLLDLHGQVSVETAQAMAEAARHHLNADVGVATTGVAGPEALEGHPPGTVCVAVATPAGCAGTQLFFPRRRHEVKRWATLQALHLLRRHLLALPVT
ncbi:MAG: competence/damage-inducible protein A [Chloroflexi bacterium]|nr:competence/damage-inducible protein A [Chloroflexota bacterium]